MGIKHFFIWFKNQFSKNIISMKSDETFTDVNTPIDNLMLDLNGILHNSAQKVYEYGNFKPQRSFLGFKKKKFVNLKVQQENFFKEVCATIEHLLKISQPRKRLIMCIDGVAPTSKQNQQRCRRFRAVSESDNDNVFDSTCLSPGTKLMDHLSKYIDWYIRKRISEDPIWQNIEVIFSNEKVPGEGEHRCSAEGTKILLYNGSIKNVEDVRVGDILIGDDGQPRNVLSLVSGYDEMYEIQQTNAENYTVNKNHILSLEIADHKRIYLDSRDGWTVGFFNRETNRYNRKSFAFLKEGETLFTKITEYDRTCTDCSKTYTTRENYGKHMKKKHNVNVPKLKTYGKVINKTKDEAYNDAINFLNTIDDDNVIDISVIEYLKLPKNTQRKLYGYRSYGINWEKKEVKIDPYLLGLWLGDGTAIRPEIANIDVEVIDFLKKYANENVHRLSYNGIASYRLCDDKNYRNKFMDKLKYYNLIGNKHIPIDYKVNDRETRLKLLAGMIDSDGNLTQKNRLIRINQCIQHKQLFDDFVYLARSLGFCVNIRPYNKKWIYKGTGKENDYFNMTISGDLIQEIPTLIKRKYCKEPFIPGHDGIRSIKVNKNRTSIKVVPVDKNKYYGFNIDKNNRYLLGDFTVTHNCFSYVRKYGTEEESYCLHALDADIIMLALASHKPNFYVLREDLYDPANAFFNINIGEVRKQLVEMLKFDHKNFKPEYAVNDFVFLAFIVGNDFLPHIPSLEILEGGIDVIIDVYKNVGKGYGHITQKSGDKISFVRHALEVFMGTISQYEKGMLEEKMNRKQSFFPDLLLEKHCKFVEMQNVLNIDEYRSEYLYSYFPEDADEEKICHEYLEGMQWVLSYYTSGLTNWDWSYPYHYAPFAFHLSRNTRTFKFLKYPNTSPVAPYIQLLSILPPKSSRLLPEPLDKILTSTESPLKLYCPDEIVIDLSGKRKEWEGIVILPMIDREIVKKEYFKYVDKVDRRELNRNKLGKSFIYKYNDGFSTVFSSYYGDIKDCKVYTTIIEL
jgi:hypothetical protein